MALKATAVSDGNLLVIPEKRDDEKTRRKTEEERWRAVIGAALDHARTEMRWTIDQLAAEMGRDPRQIGHWLQGTERPLVDAVLAVPKLRTRFVWALAIICKGAKETRLITRIEESIDATE